MTRLLFIVQWQQLRNTWFKQGEGKTLLAIMALILAVGLLIMISIGLGSIASVIPVETMTPLLSMALAAGLAIVLLFTIPQVFKHLYSSRDVELLFTLPLPTQSIFWVKYVQSFLSVAGIIWLFSVVPLFYLGSILDVSWLFYPIAFLVTLSFVVAAVSIAYLFNLGLIQMVPANRANELMTVMSGLAVIVVYLIIQIPNLFVTSGLQESAAVFHFPDWLPMTWGADSMINAAQGDYNAFIPAGMTVAVAGLLVYLSSKLVERGFRTGWIRINEGGTKKRVRTKGRMTRSLRHPIVFIGIKEWRSIQRDLREWMTFLPLLVFMFFPLIISFSGGNNLNLLMSEPLLTWTLAQAMILFFFTILSGPLAASAIGREGRSAWILHMLPLSGWQIALGKFWISWLIPLCFVIVIEFGLGLFLHWTPFRMISGIIIYALLSTGITGVGLWLGTVGAKYNPVNPQNRLTFGTGLLMFVLSYVYLILVATPAITVLLPASYGPFFADAGASAAFLTPLTSGIAAMLSLKETSESLVFILGLLCLIIVSLGLTTLALYMSAKRISRGIEIQIDHSGKKGLK